MPTFPILRIAIFLLLSAPVAALADDGNVARDRCEACAAGPCGAEADRGHGVRFERGAVIF